MENGYKIFELPTRGRGLEATRDFQPGEVIFQDSPVILGPRVKPLCVGCHGRGPYTDCPRGCRLPICSPGCSESPLHVDECRLLRKSLPEQLDAAWKSEITSCLVVLRCLFMDVKDRQFMQSLQGHPGKIHGFEAKILKKYLGTSLSEEDEIWLHKCCEILDTNAFDVTDGTDSSLAYNVDKTSLRGLYRLASFINHDCSPNTCVSFSSEGVMFVSAARPILAGEEITTIYCTMLWNTPTRRDYLSVTKHFLCQCDRCKDPSEFGAFLSSLACPVGTGYLLPVAPQSPQTSWRCNCCSLELTTKQISFLNMAQSIIMSRLDSSKPTSVNTFLADNNIPPTNQVAVALKLEAVQKLGYMQGYQWKELTDDSLDLKEMLCRDILSVMDRLRIGHCRSKGLVLLELHCVLSEKLKRLDNNGTLQKELWTKLCNTLAEAQKIFNVNKTAPKLLDQQTYVQQSIAIKTDNNS